MKTQNKQNKLDTNKIYIFDKTKNKWIGYKSMKFAFNKMLGVHPQKKRFLNDRGL